MAKSLCGARDRFDPSRVFGPRPCVQRRIASTRASLLHPLLSRVAFAFIVGQGFAGFTRGPVCRESRRDFSSRRPALPIRPARSLTFRPLGRSRANRPTENYIARLSSTFVSMSFLMTLSKNPAHNVRSRDSRTFPTVDTLRKTSFTDFLV